MHSTFQELEPRRAPRMREAAYSALKEAILAGRIEAGEPLFEERIAAALGISRTPVREALAILEHEGLIAPRGGRGLFIRDLTRDEFQDMFTANEVVEPYLARRAALRATEFDIESSQAAVDAGRIAALNLDLHASLRSGRDFHRCIGRAAGNDSLTQLVVRNEEQADLFLLSLGDLNILDAAHMEASNREHQAILDAIQNRDSEAASGLVIFHAQSLRTRHAAIFRAHEARVEAAGVRIGRVPESK